MMRSPLRRKRGFSLIEALFALFVLAIGTLALCSTVVASKKVQTEAVEIHEAGKVANAIMECFRKMPYICLEETCSTGTYTIEQLGNIYDAENTDQYLIDYALLSQLRYHLDYKRMHAIVRVDQGEDAMLVSVEIMRKRDLQTVNPQPLVTVTGFIAENGINFRS